MKVKRLVGKKRLEKRGEELEGNIILEEKTKGWKGREGLEKKGVKNCQGERLKEWIKELERRGGL